MAKKLFCITLNGFAMAVFMQRKVSKPLLQNQCYMKVGFHALHLIKGT